MNSTDTLTTLYRHNLWANLRMVECCAKLTDEQLNGTLIGTSGSGLIAWAAKVQAEDTVQVDREGTPRQVPKAILLTQAINHATEHRSQIMAILTHLGVQPPALDGWTYFDSLEP